MTEHKCTDEEVIKAFDCCHNIHLSCIDCPFLKYSNMCSRVEILALDLINRQKAEISALTSAVDNSTQEFLKLHDKYQEQKAEIERLHSEVKEKTETIVFLKDQATGWSIDFCNLKKKLNTAKAEAIKEFAEKLKEKAYVNKPYGVGKSVDECDVDALVKEMTEI